MTFCVCIDDNIRGEDWDNYGLNHGNAHVVNSELAKCTQEIACRNLTIQTTHSNNVEKVPTTGLHF